MTRDFTKQELDRQAVAASHLLDEIGRDDDDLSHDMVEGETGFFEAAQIALDEIAECEIMAAGIAEAQKKLADRKRRVDARAERLRGMLDQAFQIASIKTHKFPTATITTKAVPEKLIVSDESAIPAKFFEPQPPKLDRKALLDALKSGSKQPGAELSNGGQTIQIRRA